jgi:hypothetical protein
MGGKEEDEEEGVLSLISTLLRGARRRLATE